MFAKVHIYRVLKKSRKKYNLCRVSQASLKGKSHIGSLRTSYRFDKRTYSNFGQCEDYTYIFPIKKGPHILNLYDGQSYVKCILLSVSIGQIIYFHFV